MKGIILAVGILALAMAAGAEDSGVLRGSYDGTTKRVLKGLGTAAAVVGIGFVALVGLVFLVCAGGGR